MLTLASYLSEKHTVDIFWDDPEIKAPLSRFLKIDLTKTHFKPNIFNHKLQQRILESFTYKAFFILSDGSIPAIASRRSILHFQVPFKFKKVDLKTKLKIKSYKYIICNSQFTKRFIDETFHISSKVIYPPVDVKDIVAEEKENLIMSVGRFSQKQLHPKRQEILIEVFKEIYKKFPNWKLLLTGQAKKEDEKYLRSLKKSARGIAIRIDENMPIDQLRKYYSKASIYWHATGFGEDEELNPERMEHFGISTVEAQAAGAVPVVIGKGGQKEIVENNVNGKLWTTKTQIYESTIELIENAQMLKKLSQAAIKSSKKFSKEKFLQEYEKIFF